MKFLGYIHFPIFLISFILGLIAVHITMPDTRKIYVYPTPENVDLLQYRDKTNTCFSLKQIEVKCPANENLISKIPIQS